MFSRCFCFILFVLGISFYCARAQSVDFCNAVNTIAKDAPNRFRNVRGKTIETTYNASMWDASIKVPGTISSRFVASMGLFYEGAFFQTANIDDLEDAYAKYKTILTDCLAAEGYTLSLGDNFYKGLSSYKKLVFMKDEAEDNADASQLAPPAHITMEVTYSKEVGKYTIVMFIFEH